MAPVVDEFVGAGGFVGGEEAEGGDIVAEGELVIGRSSEHPTSKCKLSHQGCKSVTLEESFTEELIGNRVRNFYFLALENMNTQCAVKGINPSRSGFLVLF